MENGLPTRWQRVILKNYGMIPADRIAKVLETDEETVRFHAKKLGFFEIEADPNWEKKGFVTVIRNNWDLLLDEDICTLLSIGEAEYRQLLEEYDFLSVKLGDKPKTEKIKYAPLSKEQEAETEKVCKILKGYCRKRTVKPFDFYNNSAKTYYEKPFESTIEDRFTASYSARYSGALLDDELSDYPEEYLERLKACGVNGIWLQETLRNLADFPFDRQYAPDYQKRLGNLKKLTERCERYGIGVYLYMNEPRSLPAKFFEKYPQWKGQEVGDGNYCLCTSAPEVQKYLYDAMKSVAENVPKLKAIVTITMSENATHCYSKIWPKDANNTECPRCKERTPEEVAAEVNNIFYRAIRDGNKTTRLIANLWGWADYMGWTEEQVLRGVKLLDKGIDVLCVSEFGKKFVRGGVQSQVIDYSISVIGPSDFTVKVLTFAKACGHRIWAKIQVNNSWECSAVPYIPVFDRMVKHIENLKKLDVSGLMMGWSLGGYPGGALSLCCMACGRKTDEKKWYNVVYGEQAALAKRAVGLFSDAFGEYPFSVDILYLGGHNLGCGNLWSLKNTGRKSTMVCYTFDDYKAWTSPYGVEVYISQMDLLTTKWKEGLDAIGSFQGNAAFEELKRCAKACFIHFMSAKLLAEFSVWKENLQENREKLLGCVRKERELVESLYSLVEKDAKIGFEMTNHYYYSDNVLLEKLLNLSQIEEELQNISAT